jgi:hypothetical protein
MEMISQHPSHFITYNIGSTEELSVEPWLEAATEEPFLLNFSGIHNSRFREKEEYNA